MKRRFILLFVMMLSVIRMMAVTATNVKYIDANGVEQTCPEATVVTTSEDHVEWAAGWYVVRGLTVRLKQAVDCLGDVHLILADGAKLICPGKDCGRTGIWVGYYNTLHIYGQSAGTGTLEASGANGCAAIGGGYKYIIINGGTIVAAGGSNSAGIGARREDGEGKGIIINGGTITATGGDNGAGIGCGYYLGNCGSITINGGNITATGGENGAGIGTALASYCDYITITGGSIRAVGGEHSAGIGGAPAEDYYSGYCGMITISGDDIEIDAQGASGASGIGRADNSTYWAEADGVQVSTDVPIYVGKAENSADCFTNTGGNIIDSFKNYRYIKITKLLCFKNYEGTPKISFNKRNTSEFAATLQYSTDLHTWNDYEYGSQISLSSIVFFRAKGTNGVNSTFGTADNNVRFSSTGLVLAYGTVMSLLDASCKATSVPAYAFRELFSNCAFLKTAPTLPATTLGEACYQRMFYGCSMLEEAPALPAETLAKDCYASMFYGCSDLNYLDVKFTDWNEANGSTTDWVKGVAATGTFHGPYCICGETSSSTDYSHVPYGWTTDPIRKNIQTVALTDASEPYAYNGYYADNITYTRTTTHNWGTLVLPFGVKTDAENYQLYALCSVSTDAGSGKMVFTPVDEVPANTPCVFKKLNNGNQVVFASTKAIDYVKAPSTASAVDGWTLKGTYENLTNQTGMYFIAKDKFWYAESPISIAPFRAWFECTLPADVKSLSIIIDDDETGINQISPLETEGAVKLLENGKMVIIKNGVKYNAQGQLLNY